MKDAARSKKAFYNTVRGDLIDNHPKMFNIFLALAFIFLAGSTVYLISDILSFKADASHKAPLSGFHLQIPKEITTAIKNWQAKGLKLVDQGKNIVLNKGPQNKTRTSQKISTGDNGKVLRTKNGPTKAKSGLAKAELPSLPPVPMNSTKSSRNKTLILPSKSSIATITSSTESGSGSDSSWEREPLQSDDNYYDVDTAPLNNSSEIDSQIDLSIVHNKSIDNITDNLPVLKIAADSNYISDYIPSSNITNVSFNNSSSVSIVSEPLQIDMSSLNSSNASDRTTPESNDAADLNAASLNLPGKEFPGNANISSDNSSSSSTSHEETKANFTASNSMGSYDNVTIDNNDSLKSLAQGLDSIANKASNPQQQIEENRSTLSLLDKINNLTTHVVTINNISSSSIANNISITNNTSATNSSSITMSKILSNNAKDQNNHIIKSLENSDGGSKISETANGSSQNNEIKQSQLNTQTKAIRSSLGKSTRSLLQKANKNTGEVQSSGKNASDSSGDESVQSQSDSNSRFKKLKIQTPFWMAKA